MIVSIDKQTGDLVLVLPPEHEKYKKELESVLYEEFAFEPMNKIVISRMNRFVEEWFGGKGIVLNSEQTK